MPNSVNLPVVRRAKAVWALLHAVPFYADCCLAMIRARGSALIFRNALKR
jgi:hypothetical protein